MAIYVCPPLVSYVIESTKPRDLEISGVWLAAKRKTADDGVMQYSVVRTMVHIISRWRAMSLAPLFHIIPPLMLLLGKGANLYCVRLTAASVTKQGTVQCGIPYQSIILGEVQRSMTCFLRTAGPPQISIRSESRATPQAWWSIRKANCIVRWHWASEPPYKFAASALFIWSRTLSNA